VQVYGVYSAIHSFGYIPMGGRAGSYDSSIFSFSRTLHTDCHSGFLSFWHPHQHLSLFVILTGMRWNFDVILTCITFMAEDVEHFFMYLLLLILLLGADCSVLLPIY
jgi:hypothetical protein